MWEYAPPFIYYGITVAAIACIFNIFSILDKIGIVGTWRDNGGKVLIYFLGIFFTALGQIFVTLKIFYNKLNWPLFDSFLISTFVIYTVLFACLGIILYMRIFLPAVKNNNTIPKIPLPDN